jgi:hypothetical protein
MPLPVDAGLVYIGRIHKPWTSRIEAPRPGRRPASEPANGVIGSGAGPTTENFREGLGQVALALLPGSDQTLGRDDP